MSIQTILTLLGLVAGFILIEVVIHKIKKKYKDQLQM